MKLRYFAAAMTEVVAGAAVAAGMWMWSNADILEILFMVLLMAPLAGLAVLVATEPGTDLGESVRDAIRELTGRPRKENRNERKAA